MWLLWMHWLLLNGGCGCCVVVHVLLCVDVVVSVAVLLFVVMCVLLMLWSPETVVVVVAVVVVDVVAADVDVRDDALVGCCWGCWSYAVVGCVREADGVGPPNGVLEIDDVVVVDVGGCVIMLIHLFVVSVLLLRWLVFWLMMLWLCMCFRVADVDVGVAAVVDAAVGVVLSVVVCGVVAGAVVVVVEDDNIVAIVDVAVV